MNHITMVMIILSLASATPLMAKNECQILASHSGQSAEHGQMSGAIEYCGPFQKNHHLKVSYLQKGKRDQFIPSARWQEVTASLNLAHEELKTLSPEHCQHSLKVMIKGEPFSICPREKSYFIMRKLELLTATLYAP